jgi:hypothetical protein
MTGNALRSVQDETTILQRLEDLESKVEDMEMILAGLLPLPQRRSGSIVLWFRRLVLRPINNLSSRPQGEIF